MQINRKAPTTSGAADGGIEFDTNSDAGSKLLVIGARPSSDVVVVVTTVVVAGAGAAATGTATILLFLPKVDTWDKLSSVVAPRQPVTTSASAKMDNIRRLEICLGKAGLDGLADKFSIAVTFL